MSDENMVGGAPPAGSPGEPKPLWKRILASRALVIFLFAWPLAFALTGVFLSLKSDPPGARTVTSPFKAWDGEWEGELVTRRPDGAEVSRVRATQTFRHVPAKKEFHQEAHFNVTDAKTGEAGLDRQLNRTDFELKNLRRKLIRKNGNDTAMYGGRIEGDRLIWSRHGPGYSEEITEWVEGDVYHVRGKVSYGVEPNVEELVFEGEYRRVK